MTNPQIHGNRSSFSASKVVDALGKALADIRQADDLGWKDVGRVFGKSEDRAAAYAAGLSEMGVVSFLLGCREWNGRFANDALALIGMKLVPLNGAQQSDRAFGVIVAELNLAVHRALEDDDVIDEAELGEMQAILDVAGRAIDARKSRPAKLEAVS